MSNGLEKRQKNSLIGDSAQYVLAFGVIGVMLYVIGLPSFVIFFIGAFSYFLWKLFSSGTATETRRIFEFYLVANEILRSDNRRWYGFELQEAIAGGEKVLANMRPAPPLAHFALGCLYHKKGDNAAAIKYLEHVFEEGGTSETSIVFPTNELRDYVRILRKIERDPAEAPQTAAAIRSLERLRKNKGKSILDNARHLIHEDAAPKRLENEEADKSRFIFYQNGENESMVTRSKWTRNPAPSSVSDDGPGSSETAKKENAQTFAARKPISEVLQDIYDDKVS